MRLLIFAVTLGLAPTLLASPVVVTVTGTVEFNQITDPPLGNFQPSDAVELSFTVDSESFVNNMTFPTRGYDIDPSSLVLMSGGNTVLAQSPFPGDTTPYFVLRDNDPAVDGFFLSVGLDLPAGIPLSQTGAFGQFLIQFSVTYEGDVLGSLDITEAFGSYDFDRLTVFNWTVEDGPFQPLGLVFAEMTIAQTGQIFADGFESGDLGSWSSPSL